MWAEERNARACSPASRRPAICCCRGSYFPFELLVPVAPAATQIDFAVVGKEVRGLGRADEHHVVVEVQKRSARPSMRHSMVSMAYELKVGRNCS